MADEATGLSTEQVADAEKQEQETKTDETTEKQEETQATEGGETKADEKTEPPKKTAQERINEITRARRAAERQAEQAKQEAEYWRQEALKKAKADPEPDPMPQQSDRPRREQYKTEEDYEEALVDWKLDKREGAKREAEQQRKNQESFRKFNTAADKMREKYEDFDEVIQSPVFSATMRAVILKSENGPLVAYHLGRPENSALADRLLSLSPEEQIYELGKLEPQLVVAEKTKKTTGAPAPLNPVNTTGGGVHKDESKMSDDEWWAAEQKKRRAKIEAKYKGG